MVFPSIEHMIDSTIQMPDDPTHVKHELVGEVIRALGVASQKGLSKKSQMDAIHFAMEIVGIIASDNEKIYT